MASKNKQAQLKGRKMAAAKAAVSGEAKPEKVAKVAKPVKEGALPPLPRLPSAARTRKPKPEQPCSCGCGTPTRSLWAPGHDARARGWAIRIERGICKMADVPANEQAGAKLMLKTRKDTGVANDTDKIKLVKKAKAASAGEATTEPVAEPEQADETEPVDPAVNG